MNRHLFSVCTEKTALVRNQKYYKEIKNLTSLPTLVKILRRTKILYRGSTQAPIFLVKYNTDLALERPACLLSQKKFLKSFHFASNLDQKLTELKIFKQLTNIEKLDYNVRSNASRFCNLYNLRNCKSLTVSSFDGSDFNRRLRKTKGTNCDLKSTLSIQKLDRLLPLAKNLRYLKFDSDTFKDKATHTVLPILFKHLHLFSKSLIIDIFFGSDIGNQIQGLIGIGQSLKITTDKDIIPKIVSLPYLPVNKKVEFMYPNHKEFYFNLLFQKVTKINLNLREMLDFKKYVCFPETLEEIILKINYRLSKHPNGIPLDPADIDFSRLTHLKKLSYAIQNISNVDSNMIFLKSLNTLKNLDTLKLEFSSDKYPYVLSFVELIDNLAYLKNKNLTNLALFSHTSLEGMTRNDYKFFENIKDLKILGRIYSWDKLGHLLHPMKDLSALSLEYFQLKPSEIKPFFDILSETLMAKSLNLILKISPSVKKEGFMIPCIEYLQNTKTQHIKITIKGCCRVLSQRDKNKIKACLLEKMCIESFSLILGENFLHIVRGYDQYIVQARNIEED